eukprot:9489905-Pyramimonas_sp.AAC.1
MLDSARSSSSSPWLSRSLPHSRAWLCERWKKTPTLQPTSELSIQPELAEKSRVPLVRRPKLRMVMCALGWIEFVIVVNATMTTMTKTTTTANATTMIRHLQLYLKRERSTHNHAGFNRC